MATEDALATYLAALQRESSYRVVQTLKESPYERTQLVRFEASDGTRIPEGLHPEQPYIRKYIRRDAGLGTVYTRLFEAQRAGRTFRYLPTLAECYSTEDETVVVMEYIDGETLQDLVYRCDPSLELAKDVFPRICDAVTELHEGFEQPLIHRDLKPTNIMVSGDRLTIIDFGIAREYKDDAANDTMRFGTRAFAPPEQFGYGQTTVRSDVYALGMLLYFCLTEKIPTAEIREEGFDDPRIPQRIRDVLAIATAFDPAQRFASARALKQAFLEVTANTAPKPAIADVPARSTEGDAGALVDDASVPVDGISMPSEAPAKVPVATQEAPMPGQIAATAKTAMPSQSHVSPQSSYKHKAAGLVWNVILAFCVVIAIGGAVYALTSPTNQSSTVPMLLRGYTYIVAIPVVSLVAAFVLSDKRPLYRWFPRLERIAMKRWLLLLVAVIVIAIILFFIVGLIARG